MLNSNRFEETFRLVLLDITQSAELVRMSADELVRLFLDGLEGIRLVRSQVSRLSVESHMEFLAREVQGEEMPEFDVFEKMSDEQSSEHERRTQPLDDFRSYLMVQDMRQRKIKTERSFFHVARLRYEFLTAFRRQLYRAQVVSETVFQMLDLTVDIDLLQNLRDGLGAEVQIMRDQVQKYFTGETSGCMYFDPIREMIEIDAMDRSLSRVYSQIAAIEKYNNEAATSN